MSFNYSNLGRTPMQNMMPLMGNLPNANGNNFITQLAAAVTAAASVGSMPTNMGSGTKVQQQNSQSIVAGAIVQHQSISSVSSSNSRVPVAPPPPSFNDSPLEFKNSSNVSSAVAAAVAKLKFQAISSNERNQNLKTTSSNNKDNNQQSQQMGAGPMDLENDLESQPSEGGGGGCSGCGGNSYKSLTGINNLKRCLGGDKPSSSTENVGANAAGVNTAAKNDKTSQILMGNDMFLNTMLGMGAPHQRFMMMPPGMIMDPSTAAMAAMQMQQFPLIHSTTAAHISAAAGAGTGTPAVPVSDIAHSSTINTQSNIDAAAAANSIPPVKEMITCKSCTLFPPNPNAPPPTIRERPPGCRTVFVGGLPENVTEDIIREIFESCGEITTLRLSKKNFCHIRFVFQASVDSAIYLSGYRIRIMNNEPTNCGRLHVDYAQARDDQYEWECKQRQLQREQRHRERMERDRLRSDSPPPIVHYTEHEAATIAESLKNDESFLKAVQTLIVWLERGDCSKKNANVFYSMIQSTNAHVRRLNNDKIQFEEELRRAREQYRKQMFSMSQQFTQIEKVFSAASHKKVWDHFTKAQRKNIDQWKKLSMELRSVQIEDDEMEMSDDDRDYRSCNSKRSRYDTENLKEENDSLRCQVEAYKNEMTLVKTDNKSDSDVREKQIKVLQETIRNMQTQFLETKYKEKSDASRIEDLEKKLKEAGVKQLLLKTKIVEVNARHRDKEKDTTISTSSTATSSKNSESSDDTETPPIQQQIKRRISQEKDVVIVDVDDEDKKNQSDVEIIENDPPKGQHQESIARLGDEEHSNKMNNSTSVGQIKKEIAIALNEAKIIGLVSTFLVVHPLGASSEYISSYLQKIIPTSLSSIHQLEEILEKYSNIFDGGESEDVAKRERKWKFCGFSEQSSSLES